MTLLHVKAGPFNFEATLEEEAAPRTLLPRADRLKIGEIAVQPAPSTAMAFGGPVAQWSEPAAHNGLVRGFKFLQAHHTSTYPRDDRPLPSDETPR